jgi:uncharacterized paraquat-inducible protein A
MACVSQAERVSEGPVEAIVMTFRISRSPKYERGEKYCPRCRIVHPPEYRSTKCVSCAHTLRSGPRASRDRERLRQLGVLSNRYVDADIPEDQPVLEGR